MRIDAMTADDWPAVREIYEEGLATGNGSFETEAPSWDDWNAKRTPHTRLVARDGAVIGWVALTPVSTRACYAGVAEIGIYVAAAARGRGVGKALMDAAIASAESHGIWTLQASTFPENTASLALQRRCGFREIGYRERIARHHGVWRDTIIMERRSARVGAD